MKEYGFDQKGTVIRGQGKKVFATQDSDYVIVSYKDDATALNGLKRGTISGKGEVNNRVSNILFHTLKRMACLRILLRSSPRETAVKRVSIVPVEVVVRNVAAGSLAKRLGIPEGTVLKKTVLEFYYKDDALGDPLINCSHIYALDLATKAEMDRISELALKVDGLLSEYFAPAGVRLIDYKLEFGRFHDQIILADEISPDTCRFWDDKTGRSLIRTVFAEIWAAKPRPMRSLCAEC